MAKKKCVLCGIRYEGIGNNSEPIKKGLCCELCNLNIVIPQRMKNIWSV